VIDDTDMNALFDQEAKLFLAEIYGVAALMNP